MVSVLDDRVVLVTGAGQGLGRAYALACAAAGAAVVVNDVDADRARSVRDEVSALGGTASVSTADVSDPAAVAEMVEQAVSEHGGLDGLVNNAAVYDIVEVGEVPVALAERALRVNVLGPVICFEAALPHLRARGGAVVNVTSGAQCGMPRLSVYGATKGAVASLTYGWAADLDGSGVRVNAISPTAATRMVEVSREVGLPGIDSTTPPQEVAPLVVFLLSDLSGDVTGQVFRLDRGDLCVMAHPHLREPVIHRDHWSVDDFVDAFAHLRDRFMPSGVVVA